MPVCLDLSLTLFFNHRNATLNVFINRKLPISQNNYTNTTHFSHASDTARDSASVDDTETECCFLLDYIICEFPRISKYPVIDF